MRPLKFLTICVDTAEMTTAMMTRHGVRRSVWDSRERLRALLDCLPVSIFVCDMDMRMVYLSPTARRTMETLRGPVRDQFGVDVDDFFGMSIHRFHKDPAAVERVMANLRDTAHEATFELAGLTLRTRITPLRETSGRTVGYIATLDDVTSLYRLTAQLSSAAAELGSSSVNLSALAEELEATTADATSQAVTLATETGQFDTAIQEVSRSAATVTAATTSAVDSASVATGRVKQLQESVERIGGLIREITSISDQTRILSLNATIEASRAGAAGKGFAVVADEVRDLAQRTSETAAESAAIIAAIRTSSVEAAAAIEEIASTIADVDAQQTQIAAAAEEQAATSRQITATVGLINHAINGVAASVTAARQSATGLAGQAGQIDELIATIR